MSDTGLTPAEEARVQRIMESIEAIEDICRYNRAVMYGRLADRAKLEQIRSAGRVRRALRFTLQPAQRVGLSRVIPVPIESARRAGVRTWAEATRFLNLPFGWTVEREEGRHAYRIGPAWYLVPRRWWRMRWWALEPLLRLGLLEIEDNDYWRNARPRGWARLQRWLAWARADFRERMPR